MSKKNRFNPVAKHAPRYNKAATFKDKKNDYKRKEKHEKPSKEEE